LRKEFKAKHAYPIFMTVEETAPFTTYYENILRPLFHNFKDLYNMHNDDLKYWKNYLSVNQKFANEICAIKNELGQNTTQVWIHNN